MMDFLNKLDTTVFLWLNGIHFPVLDALMVFLSGQFVWIPLIVFFLWKGKVTLERRAFTIFVIFMIAGLALSDVTSSYIIKNIVSRMRPCRLQDLKPLIYQFGQKCGGKYGFVSSHAANSTFVVLFAIKTLQLPKKFLWAWILPLIVGFSRIYLGVHYPGDILGGAMVGIFWGTILFKVYRRT
jgi:undecaprenyl-diphosphatase